MFPFIHEFIFHDIPRLRDKIIIHPKKYYVEKQKILRDYLYINILL